MEGEHHEKAVELLKAAPASVKLVVRYTPKVSSHGRYTPRKSSTTNTRSTSTLLRVAQVLEEMEMRFDKQRQARRRQVYS